MTVREQQREADRRRDDIAEYAVMARELNAALGVLQVVLGAAFAVLGVMCATVTAAGWALSVGGLWGIVDAFRPTNQRR